MKTNLEKYSESMWKLILKKELEDIQDKRVLDMGCGEGRFTKHLIKDNRYYGLDRVKTSITSTVCFAEVTPYRGDFFDEVLCFGLLDYSHTDHTIQEIHRVLKKGGNARIVVPNINNPYHILSSLLGRSKNRFDRSRLEKKLIKNGFEIEKSFEAGFCFWVPIFLQGKFAPIWKWLDRVFKGRFGMNIYIKASKKR